MIGLMVGYPEKALNLVLWLPSTWGFLAVMNAADNAQSEVYQIVCAHV
jgi:hypothetical protein